MMLYSEEEIIEGCRRQDRAIQEYVYNSNYSLFLQLCARYAKDMHDAEQIVQDGFLKVFLNINSYKGNGSFEGWMRRVMVNTCLDFLKSKQKKDSQRTYYPEVLSDALLTISHNQILAGLAAQDLLKLIQSLPTTSKTVFNLFVFEGYSHKEISKIMDISQGTSQWHVNNARQILQTKIKELRRLQVL